MLFVTRPQGGFYMKLDCMLLVTRPQGGFCMKLDCMLFATRPQGGAGAAAAAAGGAGSRAGSSTSGPGRAARQAGSRCRHAGRPTPRAAGAVSNCVKLLYQSCIKLICLKSHTLGQLVLTCSTPVQEASWLVVQSPTVLRANVPKPLAADTRLNWCCRLSSVRRRRRRRMPSRRQRLQGSRWRQRRPTSAGVACRDAS